MDQEDHKDVREVDIEQTGEEYIEPPLETRGESEASDDSGYSEIEKQAMAKGWKPRDEFGDSDHPYIEADEFLRNQRFVDEKNELRRQMAEQERSFKKEIREINRQIKESKRQGYEQALRDLDTKRREAVEIGDVESFRNLDHQYVQVRDELNRTTHDLQEVPEDPHTAEALAGFQERNKEWFNDVTPTNQQMMMQAINIENHLLESKPYLSVDQRLAMVEQEIKSIYRDSFNNPKKHRPTAVEGGGRAQAQSSGKPGKLSYSRLDDGDKRRCDMFLAADESFTFDDFVESALLKEKYKV